MRYCMYTEVKEGKLAEYRNYHDHIWPEVVEGLRVAGITDLHIFQVPGTRKLIMTVMMAGKLDLGTMMGPNSKYQSNPRCREWEELMSAGFHGGWTQCHEIHSSEVHWNASLSLANIRRVPESNKSVFERLTLGHFITWRTELGTVRSLVYVTSKQTVREAMLKMAEERVLSIPVWDPDTNKFVWFLSVVDVLRYCMEEAQKIIDHPNSPRKSDFVLSDVVKELEDVEGAFSLECMSPDTPVAQVMEWFSLGVHRVLVGDPASTDVTAAKVVSQSDVIQYLHGLHEEVGPCGSQSVQENGFLDYNRPKIGPTKLVTLGHTQSAIEGFKTLFENRTSALPVVDEEGKLLGSLSASDLRGLKADVLREMLTQTVLEFVKAKGLEGSNVVTCSRFSTLSEVISLFASTKSHRVWVVDDKGRVEGIITQTDILSKFAPFDYKKLHSDKV